MATPGERDDLAHLTDEERAVVAKVIEVLRKLKFGTVLLVVPDGKVVQIEMPRRSVSGRHLSATGW